MRALHIYSGNLYGGVEKALVTLARSQSLCPDLEQQFALCFEGRLSRELAASGCEVNFLGPVRVSRPLSVRRARKRLGALLRRERFDAVICHSTWSQAIFASTVRSGAVPQIFWIHEMLHGHTFLERWARLTTPTLAISNSRFTSDTLPSVYPGTAVEILYPPVEPGVPCGPEVRDEVRAIFGVPDEAVVIIQVGRVEPGKGLLCHLEALARLREIPGWVCWIVGGPQRASESKHYAEVVALAGQLGIASRLAFLGERSDVPRLLRAADIYCQPNIAPETFGITFIEALYCGLPVVTSSIGGGMEIVNRRCGMVVAPNDPSAVAGALATLIRSEELRAGVAAAARDRARELCDPHTQMSRFYRIVGSAAASHPLATAAVA